MCLSVDSLLYVYRCCAVGASGPEIGKKEDHMLDECFVAFSALFYLSSKVKVRVFLSYSSRKHSV